MDTAIHVVSYSELDALRQCPLKHHLAYTRRWKMPTVSKALQIGSLFHLIMEAHYRASDFVSKRNAVAEVILASNAADEYKETVEWMYCGYLEQYGNDNHWEIIDVEKQFTEPLRLPSGRPSKFTMKGRIDLLVRDSSAGGGLWIVDHKSCSRLPTEKELDFDDQFGIYVWMGRRKGLDIRGVVHNACRTAKLKREMKLSECFKRTYTVRTDTELERVAQEALQTFQRARLGEPGQPPRATDPDRCGWRCSFTEPCLMARKGPDIETLITEIGGERDLTRH